MITILDGKLTIPENERFIGFAGDNLKKTIEFLIKNQNTQDKIYRIYLTFDDGTCNHFTLPCTQCSDGVILTWNVLSSHIFKSGNVRVQIKAFSDNGVVYHTTHDTFIVGSSAEFSDCFSAKNTEFLEYERRLNELVDLIDEANSFTPYIGENGNWYVYDKDRGGYIDSGRSSVGTSGSAELADGAVTSAKIASGAVTANKLGQYAVREDAINPDAVTTDKIKNGAVTAEKLADGVIGSTEKFSAEFASKFFSLPLISRSINGAFDSNYCNTLLTPGIYQLDNNIGTHQVVIVLRPDSTSHLMQIRLSYDKIEYRGIWCDAEGVYADEDWESWRELGGEIPDRSIGRSKLYDRYRNIVYQDALSGGDDGDDACKRMFGENSAIFFTGGATDPYYCINIHSDDSFYDYQLRLKFSSTSNAISAVQSRQLYKMDDPEVTVASEWSALPATALIAKGSITPELLYTNRPAPSYWKSEILDTVNKVKGFQNTAGVDLINFALFSDVHYAKNNNDDSVNYTDNLGSVVAETMNELDVPFAVCLGDTTSNGVRASSDLIDRDIEAALDMLSPIGESRLLMCKGNHDGSWGSVNGTSYYYQQHPNKLWNRLFRWQAKDVKRVFSEDGSYFYADDFAQHLRMIVLNSQWADYSAISDADYAAGTTDYNTQKYSRYGSEQIKWLAEKALDLPENWTACVFSHAPVSEGADSELIRGILNAYVDRKSYTGSYTGSLNWENVVVSVDFSNAKGYFAAAFSGHKHNDIINTTSCRFPYITIDCAGNYTYNTSEETRVKGTDNETCADIVSINTKTHTIELTRLGIGSDRTAAYRVYVPVSNLFDKTADGYVDGQRTNSGGTTSDSANTFMTNYIPIISGETLCVQLVDSTNISSAVVLGGYFYMYDANKNLIGHIGWGTDGANQPYTVDESKMLRSPIGTFANGSAMSYAGNIAYIRFCVMKNANTGLNEDNLVVTKE